MKKSDFLSFHAQTLWDFSLKANYLFRFNQRYGSNDITVEEKQNSQSSNIIENCQHLEELLKKGFKFDFTLNYLKQECDFFNFYLSKIYSSSLQIQNHFISYVNSYIGELPLKNLNEILPSLNNDQIENVFLMGSNDMGVFHENDFANTVSLLKNNPCQKKLILNYLQQRKNIIKYSNQLYAIRDTLIHHFSNNIAFFQSIPVINDYLQAQEKNDVFLDNDYSKTIYLRIDLSIVADKYVHKTYGFANYKNALDSLLECLVEKKEFTGVEKTHLMESRPGNQYQYSHLYVNLNESSFLNKDELKHLLNNFFIHVQASSFSNDSFFKDYLNPWLTQYFLDKKLSTQASIAKKIKI